MSGRGRGGLILNGGSDPQEVDIIFGLEIDDDDRSVREVRDRSTGLLQETDQLLTEQLELVSAQDVLQHLEGVVVRGLRPTGVARGNKLH